jgi:hypothetical protein
MIRFSKQNLLNQLELQIINIENQWGFITTNGTNQIKDKSDFERVLAYGEYNTLLNIYESIQDNTIFDQNF